MNEETIVQSSNKTVASSILWMFFGLLSTAIIASVTYYSGVFIEVAEAWPMLLVAEIVIALVMGLCLNKLSTGVITALFFIYSMITGATFSIIFVCYELETIGLALFATAGVFGALAYLGYNTKADISKLGTILYVTLFACIIVSIVNLLIGSSGLDLMLDWVILFVFAGLTAYDMNKIKLLSETGMDQEKVAIYGAMELYLDFINLFLRILSVLGDRRK